MKALTLAAALVLGASAMAYADHANPWAGEDDDVNAQYHEANQAFSADRPGEDEMRGRQVQTVSDKAGQGQSNGGMGLSKGFAMNQGGKGSAGKGG
ncbi:hypothetical protein [Mesobacterium pallidum]|uniref:hypothetical protein n=1 Tax=Mesobacterium pallidum TaxID=2872037 RepID=UPI001EE2454D|nr:hypothetical protein [Mesobacterium pallidum]